MKSVTIFTKSSCSYCTAAKNLLAQHGYEVREFDITNDLPLRWLLREVGFRTAPVIVQSDGDPIGGYDDLVDYINDRGNPIEAAN